MTLENGIHSMHSQHDGIGQAPENQWVVKDRATGEVVNNPGMGATTFRSRIVNAELPRFPLQCGNRDFGFFTVRLNR